MDSEECDDETAEQRKGIGAVGGIEPLEKDEGGHNRRTRESNIVHRVYNIRGECVQSLIKVVHLNHYAHGGHNAKHISARVCELIIAGKGEFHRNAEALDRHDRYRADKRADGDVNDRVCAPIPRDDGEDHEHAEHSDGEAIQHEAWLEGEVENLIDGSNLFVFWSVENDDQRSKQTQCASNPSDVTKLFLQQE